MHGEKRRSTGHLSLIDLSSGLTWQPHSWHNAVVLKHHDAMKRNILSLFAGLLSSLCLNTSVVLAGDDLHVIYQEGRAAFFAGQFDLAREKLSQVLVANPSHMETRAMIAQIDQKLGSENTVLKKSYEKIIIDKIEFTDVALAEAIEAVRIKAKQATGEKVIPNIILKDPELGKKTVSINLSKIPLTEVLNYLAQLAGARLKYDKTAVIFSNLAG